MAIEQQNGDCNLTGVISVFNKTATADGEWELDIRIGDGSKDLHTDAATLTLVVTVGGSTINGGGTFAAKDAAVLRTTLRTGPIFVANGDAITATLLSNNANDTDVDVTVTPRIMQTEFAADALAEVTDAVWDEVLTSATHDTANSAGRRLRALSAESIIDGTATAGAAQTITLDGDASTTANIYNENLIVITGGTGAGQVRWIREYTAERVATVDRVWVVPPTSGSEYQIIGFSGALDTGSSLTGIPWNSDWDAEVQSECADALTAYDPPTDTEMVAAFTEIKGATWASGTDTLEHVRDKQTDIEADTNELQTDWADDGRLDLLLDAIPTTAMRGTDNAALATKLLAYLQLLARSDAAITTDNATELAEINADEGSGAGDYAATSESQEAIRDRGDSAWASASYSVSSTTTGQAPRVDIELYQYAAIGPIEITAETAQTGDSHALLVYDPAAPGTLLWSLTTDDSEIVVGGDGDCTLTITDTDAHTSTAGVFAYILRNTTDDTVVCEGALTVLERPNVAA